MAFTGSFSGGSATQAGVVTSGNPYNVNTYNFADGLKVGYCCAYDSTTDKVRNVSSTSDVLIGVVQYNPSQKCDTVYRGILTTEYDTVAHVIESGIFTAKIKSGESPSRFDKMYVGTISASAGVFTTLSASGGTDNIATNVVFWKDIVGIDTIAELRTDTKVGV